jgi:hypothetical protein
MDIGTAAYGGLCGSMQEVSIDASVAPALGASGVVFGGGTDEVQPGRKTVWIISNCDGNEVFAYVQTAGDRFVPVALAEGPSDR